MTTATVSARSVSPPDELWVADITYIPTWAGFLYLVLLTAAPFQLNYVALRRQPNVPIGLHVVVLQPATLLKG